jgi:glycosyltransferase involved in cell wall biosynthesis
VVPWGYDPAEFRPRTRPIALPTSKSFIFLYVGAGNERKGIDALLKAYLAEFSADDDVVLVIKEGRRDPTWEKWLAEIRRRYLGDRRDGARTPAVPKSCG